MSKRLQEVTSPKPKRTPPPPEKAEKAAATVRRKIADQKAG